MQFSLTRKYLHMPLLLALSWLAMVSMMQQAMAHDTLIATGYEFACGIKADRTVHCWRKHKYISAASALATVPPTGTFKQLSAADDHICGIKTDGTIACWGDDDNGEASAPPSTFMQVDVDKYHACGLRTNNTIICWGRNEEGQTNAPTGQFKQVAAASYHSCGLYTNGEIDCWGKDIQAIKVPEGIYTYVEAGLGTTCAIAADGSASCWGSYNNSLGFPAQITAVPGGIGVHNGYCALKHNGAASCDGYFGSTKSSPTGDKLFNSIATGSPSNACGILTTGYVECWGATPFEYPKDIIFLVENSTPAPTPIPNPTNQPPVATFTISTVDKAASLDATRAYDPDGTITQYNWTASNGQTSVGQTAVMNFANYGNYNIELNVIDNFGAASTATQSLTLIEGINNHTFNGSTDGNGVLTINSTENCGTNCSRQYPLNTQLTLVAAPNDGYEIDQWIGACTGSSANCFLNMDSDKVVLVRFKVKASDSEQPNTPPVANFTLTPAAGEAPLTVQLDASNSADPDGDTLSYAWTSSDGQSKTGQTTSMTFNNFGSYTITLTVDDGKDTNRVRETVNVQEEANNPPIANFTLTPTTGEAPLTVELDASASSDPDGHIIGYQWEANGETQTGQATRLTFAKDGNYTITLTVIDNKGVRDTLQKSVIVNDNPPPTARFSIEPSVVGTVPYTVTVDASDAYDAGGFIETYTWQTSDGQTQTGGSEAIVADFTFEEVGEHRITLTVTDNKDATHTISKTVSVTADACAAQCEIGKPCVCFELFRNEEYTEDSFFKVQEKLSIVLNVRVNQATRFEDLDLYVAFQFPNGELFFLNQIGGFVAIPTQYQRKLNLADDSYAILDIEVPPCFGGEYILYAAFTEVDADPLQMEFASNLVSQVVELDDFCL